MSARSDAKTAGRSDDEYPRPRAEILSRCVPTRRRPLTLCRRQIAPKCDFGQDWPQDKQTLELALAVFVQTDDATGDRKGRARVAFRRLRIVRQSCAGIRPGTMSAPSESPWSRAGEKNSRVSVNCKQWLSLTRRSTTSPESPAPRPLRVASVPHHAPDTANPSLSMDFLLNARPGGPDGIRR